MSAFSGTLEAQSTTSEPTVPNSQIAVYDKFSVVGRVTEPYEAVGFDNVLATTSV